MAQRGVKWPFLRVSTELSQNTEFLECPSGSQPNCGRAKQSNFLIFLPLLIIINTTPQTPFEVRVHCSLAKETKGNPPYFSSPHVQDFSLKPIRKGAGGLQNNNREVLFASMCVEQTSTLTQLCPLRFAPRQNYGVSCSLRSPSRGILPVLRLGTDDRGVSEYCANLNHFQLPFYARGLQFR